MFLNQATIYFNSSLPPPFTLRLRLPVSATRWDELGLGIGSLMLCECSETPPPGKCAGAPFVLGLPGWERESARLPRRLLLLLISRRFPTSATRAQGRELRAPRLSVGECECDREYGNVGLPSEEESEGGGTDGYERDKEDCAGNGGGGVEWRDGAAEDGVVTCVAFET